MPESGKLRLAIFGAGIVGKDFYFHYRADLNIEIVAFVDNNAHKIKSGMLFGIPVISPDSIDLKQTDLIAIALKDEGTVCAVRRQLLALGAAENKIIHYLALYSVIAANKNTPWISTVSATIGDNAVENIYNYEKVIEARKAKMKRVEKILNPTPPPPKIASR